MRKLLCCLIVLFHHSVQAKVTLPNILGSHMVLQQHSTVKFWGRANPTEKITILPSWDTVSYKIVANGSARWETMIKTPASGGPYSIKIIGSNTIVLEDVLIGEVWLCGGQSNMEWSGLNKLEEAIQESPKATNEKIRFFYVPKSTSYHPQDDISDARWVVCTPQEMLRFSTIGYFFGKELNGKLDRPIGLISSCWGGTYAESWSPEYVIENNALIKKGAALRTVHTIRPHENSVAYNAMIYPLTQFAIAGVIWYQGESNVNAHFAYDKLFSGLIDSWRAAWQLDFPFYYVQIAPYKYGFHNVGVLLREKQTKVSTHLKSGMVVISDLVPDTLNIHPTKKVGVALRLANLALRETYGYSDIQPYSPTYSKHTIQKSKITIEFNHAESGLIVVGDNITCFEVAGKDQVFYPAEASIVKNKVVVFSESVAEPVAIRYAFSNTAIPNLFNKEGLPANMFRTDNWEVATPPVK
ncbi:MAG: sialate O-acetylesterase [Sphingobacteriales bacterium]